MKIIFHSYVWLWNTFFCIPFFSKMLTWIKHSVSLFVLRFRSHFLLKRKTECQNTINEELRTHSHTHTHTLSLSLSHTHTHTLSLSLSLSHTHTHTHSLSLSLSLTHTHTHTHSLSLSLSKHTHTHTHSLSLSLSLTHTHTLSLSLSLSLSLTHTHTHTLSLSLTHTHTHVVFPCLMGSFHRCNGTDCIFYPLALNLHLNLSHTKTGIFTFPKHFILYDL